MVLETDRLCLLSPDGTDAEAVAEYMCRNREFMREFEPEREKEYYTPDYHREMLKRQTQEWKDQKGYRFYLSPKEERTRIIGFVGLNNVIMGPFCSCFIGCQLDREYLRRGLMTEAVNQVVQYGFDCLGLHRIEGNIMPRNKASMALAEKCGFVNEGLSRKYLKINGVWEDHVHFVKLNEAMG